MTLHSAIGASSMDRWSHCPGSVRLSKDLPSRSSSYADEGTRAHTVGEEWLRTGLKPAHLDHQMREAVQQYVEYVLARGAAGATTRYLEHGFDLSSIHPGCFGTADAVLWNPTTRHLEVVDYKHGAGIYVPVVNNPQLRYYGLGALIDLKLPAVTITLTIVQPRCDAADGGIRSETLDVIDLLDFAADLQRYATATEDPHAPLVPGEHCRFCPVAQAHQCPELQAQTQAIAKTEFRSDLSFDPASLSKALDSREFVKAWLKTLDEFAYHVLEQGGHIAGYKLVAKRATRKWKSEDAAQLALHPYTSAVDIYEPHCLKSPAQMEKLLPKAVVAGLVEAISSGHTVVEASDTRPSVKTSAKEDFNALASSPGLVGGPIQIKLNEVCDG